MNSNELTLNILSLICYEKFQTENQTCPDFELRWCCAQNDFNSTKRIQEKIPSYADDYLDDQPQNSQSIRFEAFDKYNLKLCRKTFKKFKEIRLVTPLLLALTVHPAMSMIVMMELRKLSKMNVQGF